jgi:hypothetical protein
MRPAVAAERVVVHLADVHSAVGAPIDRDGVGGERFRGDQLGDHPGTHFDCREGLLRREGLRPAGLVGGVRGAILVADQLLDGVDDRLLETRLEWPGQVVIDHCSAAFVAAFLQDALRRDVARDVVRVGVNPEPAGVQLALES